MYTAVWQHTGWIESVRSVRGQEQLFDWGFRTEELHIVKLSLDQATSFGAVKRLDMEVSMW
jgi:hypothetical protein